MRAIPHVSRALATIFMLATASVAFAADGDDWTVHKSSGEVWLAGSGVQPASLKQEDVLKPGDTIRTGRTGRVLLKRGDEMILVSPNSMIGVPAQKKEGLSTTIKQQAGSILLDVEKRNVKHFEVETPYLAAVVKGTQFRVTVNAGKTTVDVIRGQVEVADFKSGQIAQVIAGQHATAFANGKTGLSLGGAGALAPIEQGKPRAPSVERVPVPRGGFTAIRHATNGPGVQPSRHASVQPARQGVTRISSSIGEVRLNVHRATNGLAHDKSAAHGGTRNATNKDTIWGSFGSGNDSASANAATSGVSSTVAAVSGGGNGNGNGNGNANGNGNENGHGNGNGNAYGRYKNR
ncbi:FecR family protein [Bradyrhizobium sp. AUGA SZCCT0283]|uniref:FecR family protein n=1 Tax=Bradyrhizobium sp. AUGA SZCCT0283 TaxID=2807671 RepID=UPI001BA6ACD0|nr:FecR family protein [Bradyrhizobium sp. AUGA SZCCT0283]MBR1277961.1 FecR domain-containing protein [Bradyrhizobium sp. AUGA SZCCT0283]